MKKAYFTSSKQGQNIVFSWDQNKTSLEHFFPCDMNYQNDKPMVIKDKYNVSMNQNNLSNACLKVNDKLLSNLLIAEGKLPHSLDNVDIDNNDSTSIWSIEEKFVHYCTISSATSNVTFYNNSSNKDSPQTNNKIATEFTICYLNSKKNKFDNVANKAEVSNVKLSNNFCDEAVGYYNDVNSYTDSQQIEDDAKKAIIDSGAVIIYLCLMATLLFITLVAIIIKHWICKYNLFKREYGNPLTNSVKNNPLIAFTILFALATILFVTWYSTIDVPINEHFENVTKWNNALKNDETIGKLHVLEKIKEDKQHFATASNFKKIF